MKSELSDPDFEQLVRRTLTDVAATTPEPSTGADTDRRSTIRTTWAVAAAALLVLVGVGALIVAQRQPEELPTAQYTSRIDPVAHLFVLPTDSEGLVLEGGDVYTARPEATSDAPDQVGFLMGIPLRDGAFSDLVQVTTSTALADGYGAEGTTGIDTSTGPAVVDSSFGYRLAQQRGDVWLLLTAKEENPRMVDALAQITIDPEGTPALGDGAMTVIETFRRSADTVDYSTYYEVTDTATGTTFVVETATSSSVLAFSAFTFDTTRPITVNGTPAWTASREGDPPAGVNSAVVWQATPNRIVAISAQERTEVVMAMAERLREVSSQEWLAALPGAAVEN